jgi:hypothetical protein
MRILVRIPTIFEPAPRDSNHSVNSLITKTNNLYHLSDDILATLMNPLHELN